MQALGRFNAVLLLIGLGYLGFYVYAIVIGLLDPAEVVAAGILAAVIAVAFLVHAVRVRRAMSDHDDPSHRTMMTALHAQRERRGF
jgi:hypothetical protein